DTSARCAPAVPSARAMALPSPLLAPVITATFPSSGFALIVSSARCSAGSAASQLLQFDVFEPAWASVVLESDIALARMIPIGDIKLMGRTVRAFVRFGEQVQIGARNRFAIEHDVDAVADASDLDVIPCSGRFHRALARLYQIIDR